MVDLFEWDWRTKKSHWFSYFDFSNSATFHSKFTHVRSKCTKCTWLEEEWITGFFGIFKNIKVDHNLKRLWSSINLPTHNLRSFTKWNQLIGCVVCYKSNHKIYFHSKTLWIIQNPVANSNLMVSTFSKVNTHDQFHV